MTRLYAALGALSATLLFAVAGSSSAAGCTWQGFKVTNRQNTSCATAKKALKFYYGGGGASQGYRCKTTAATGYQGGTCKAGVTKSFRFAPLGSS